MMKSAVIVAEAAEERRSIAQLIKPTELFSRIHFCSNPLDAKFLLKNTAIDILLCHVHLSGNESLHSTAELVSLADENFSQLVFFSHLDPVELPQLGVIPAGSQCLSYDSSPVTIISLLKRLLEGENPVHCGFNSARGEKQFDRNADIYNRFYFDAFLEQELSRSKLTGRPFSILLIEAAQEEQSESGQGWGKLLPSIALTIKNQIRTSDLLCRIETKRLALLLPETTNLDANRVRQRIQQKAQKLTKEFQFDLKIGLASPNLSQRNDRHGLLLEAEAGL